MSREARRREAATRILTAILVMAITFAIVAGPRLLAWAIEAAAPSSEHRQ